MSDLSARERELVAIGAAMGSNCAPCIEHHIPAARNTGLTDWQISEAIRLADKVRQVPVRKVLDTALRMLSQPSAGGPTGEVDSVRSDTVPSVVRHCCG